MSGQRGHYYSCGGDNLSRIGSSVVREASKDPLLTLLPCGVDTVGFYYHFVSVLWCLPVLYLMSFTSL